MFSQSLTQRRLTPFQLVVLRLKRTRESKYIGSLFNGDPFFSVSHLSHPGSPSSMPHMPYEKSKMIDITRDKPIKIAVRVAVPVRDHPKVS